MKIDGGFTLRFILLASLSAAAIFLWVGYWKASRAPQDIPDFLAQERIPGAVVATFIPGQPIMLEAYGHGSLSKDQPLDPSTSFPLASISKPITAAAVRALVTQGRLQLNKRIFSVLTELSHAHDPGYADITIRHLLQHTSGLSQIPDDPVFQIDQPMGCAYAIRLTLSRQLESSPGERMRYSNTGYCLLGELIERIENQSYPDASRQLLRTSSSALDGLTFGPPLPWKQREGWNLSEVEWKSLGAAGGWFGDAASVARVLSQDARDHSIPLETTAPYSDYYYGLGWRILKGEGSYQLTHFGVLPGMFSVAVAYPDGRTAVALFNSNPRDPEKASADVRALLNARL